MGPGAIDPLTKELLFLHPEASTQFANLHRLPHLCRRLLGHDPPEISGTRSSDRVAD